MICYHAYDALQIWLGLGVFLWSIGELAPVVKHIWHATEPLNAWRDAGLIK